MDTDTQPISLEFPIAELARALREVRPPLEGHLIPRDNTVPHVSDLIQIAKPYTGPHFEGLGDLGLLWELALRPWIREHATALGFHYLPGTIPQVKDGIHGSLDGLMFSGSSGEIIVIDTKLKFSKQELPFSNRAQMKAYCHMIGAKRAILPVGRILSRPPSVSMELITLTFEDVELEQNWKMLLGALEDWRPPKGD